MKQILIQLDDRIAAELEAIAPGRSRKRSEFVRQAIARALLELGDRRTRAAYARSPADRSSLDLATWAPDSEALRRRKSRRRAKR